MNLWYKWVGVFISRQKKIKNKKGKGCQKYSENPLSFLTLRDHPPLCSASLPPATAPAVGRSPAVVWPPRQSPTPPYLSLPFSCSRVCVYRGGSPILFWTSSARRRSQAADSDHCSATPDASLDATHPSPFPSVRVGGRGGPCALFRPFHRLIAGHQSPTSNLGRRRERVCGTPKD